MASAPSTSKRFKLKKLLQPSWLAGIISVGFHSVLFAAGPTFPSLGFSDLVDPQTEAEKRNVPLVELSEAEQQRLPDFSSSLYSFDTFSDLEALSPLFENNSATPNGTNSSTQKSSTFPTRNRALSPPSSRIPFGITTLEPRSRPSTLPSFPFPGSSPPPAPPVIKPEDAAPGDGLEVARGSSGPGAADLAPLPNASSADGAESEAPIGNPTEVMTLEERLLAYTFDTEAADEVAIEARFEGWLTAGQELAIELGFAPEDIENPDDVAVLSEADIAAAAESETPIAEPVAVLKTPIELPLEHAGICLKEDPQTGLIGTWVGPEGELLGEPEIIRSTGYPGLNQQAVQYIKTIDFSEVEDFVGYQFEVVVNYDPEGCVDVESVPDAEAAPTAPGEPTESDTPETEESVPEESDATNRANPAAEKRPEKTPATVDTPLQPNSRGTSRTPAADEPSAADLATPDDVSDE